MRLPYVTEDLPGCGGRLRAEPEDFRVEEVPAYEPCGSGEHLYLEVTKRDLTTPAMLEALARALEVPFRDLGVGGLKDRRAVTTQRVSVPAGVQVDGLDLPPSILSVRVVGLHGNKLRRGHLEANRFRLRVRGAAAPERVEPVARALRERGFANFYGVQRFGWEGRNVRAGEKGVRTGKLFGPGWRKGLMVSAFQSHLFNVWLAERLGDGLFARVLEGDVCGKLPKGGVFVAEDPAAEQPRLDRFEISPMGPMFGYKMMEARGEAAEREARVLAAAGVAREDFRRVRAEGSRRRCRLALEDLRVEWEEGDPVLCFSLPSGSYATVLADEFLKQGPIPEEGEEPDPE